MIYAVVCPKCQGPLKPLSWPSLSCQCYHCGTKYLVSITTTASTVDVKYSVQATYRPKQAVPQAFADAFAGEELEP